MILSFRSSTMLDGKHEAWFYSAGGRPKSIHREKEIRRIVLTKAQKKTKNCFCRATRIKNCRLPEHTSSCEKEREQRTQGQGGN